MVDDVPWPALADSHVEGVEHEVDAQVVGYRPADDASAEGIEHNREV